MRVFIALELPEEIRTEIDKIQKGLIRVGVQARWVKPEIAHLTLTFLGSITPNKAEIISNLLAQVVRQIKPVKLKLHQVGCFPSPKKPRVIFVALQGELDKLNALAIKIQKKLKKEKIWFDQKPFSAHVTLGRVEKKLNLSKILKEMKVEQVEFIANEVTFQKSNLTKSGPIYQTLTQFRLSPYVSTQ